MIARNFVKYPEALRFQREMFSNGYHNSPRIMRLMECIFDWSATVPDWWKEAKGRARDLARRVKKSINDFFKELAVKAYDQLSLNINKHTWEYDRETGWHTLQTENEDAFMFVYKSAAGDYALSAMREGDPSGGDVDYEQSLKKAKKRCERLIASKEYRDFLL